MFKNKVISWAPAIVFVGILLAALLSQFNFFGQDTATLNIKNKASLEISEITVVLYQESCVIRNLKAGESANCSFRIQSDSHYKISWRESSETIYQEEAGYVTPGFSFEHELEFLGQGAVSFTTRENA